MRINETHIAKMLRLAEAGKTSRQIGEAVGCSPTTVRKYVSLRLQNQREGLRALYPAVWDWMEDEDITFRRIAEKSGYSESTVYSQLTGRVTLRKDIIDTVLILSKRSYEEMFGTFIKR